MEFVAERWKTEGENAGDQHFLLFPQRSQSLLSQGR